MGHPVRSSRAAVAILACLVAGADSSGPAPESSVAQGQGLSAGVDAYLCGRTAEAEAVFRAVLADPSRHAPIEIERAQFFTLKCLHRRGDLAAFEVELEALRARNPRSPALDDALFLWATFCYERGESVMAGAICDLFRGTAGIEWSEYGERAAFLALRAYQRGQDPLFFDDAYRHYVRTYPNSVNRPQADFLRAKVALDQERNYPRAAGLLRDLVAAHPESAVTADAEIDLLHALARCRDWPAMEEQGEHVTTALGRTHPRHAARALVERGLYRWILNGDDEGARELFQEAADRFPGVTAAMEAQRWLHALEDPASLDALDFHWEVALRCRLVARDRLASIRAHRAVALAGRSEAFAAHLADETVPAGERAERLYRVAYADFQTGHHAEAWARTQELRTRFGATSPGRVGARAIQAMCLVRGNELEAARDELRAVADGLETDDPAAGYVHLQLAAACAAMGDREGEAAALAELLARHPDSEGKGQAREMLDRLAATHPEIVAEQVAMATPARSVRSEFEGLRQDLAASVQSPQPQGPVGSMEDTVASTATHASGELS